MLNIFENDAFSVVRLTTRINDQPYVPGQISRAGYFEEDGIDTLYFGLEKRPEGLALVGPTPRGGPGETIVLGEDEVRLFPVPHFQRDDALLADEVQGRRAFGTEDELETVLSRIDRKIARHLRDFDATLEHQRVGAIKGIVTNKAGGVMINLYTHFEIAAPTPIYFALDTSTTDLRAKGRELTYLLEDALDGTYSGIDAWCGREFWDKLTSHKYLRDAYVALQDRNKLLGRMETDDIEAFGIHWHRYRTGAKAQAANGAVPFIAADEVRFVPRGVPELFLTRFAPADYMETVNTPGLPRYMKTIPRVDDKGVQIQVQTNPLNICTRPEILFSGKVAASA